MWRDLTEAVSDDVVNFYAASTDYKTPIELSATHKCFDNARFGDLKYLRMKTQRKMNKTSSPRTVGAKRDAKKSLEKRAAKLQNHRANMVEFRKRKKQQVDQLRNEHQRLECLMKQHLIVLESEVSLTFPYAEFGVHDTTKQIYEVVRDKEAMRKQNMVLHKEIAKYKMLYRLLDDRDEPETLSFAPVLPSTTGNGWRVHFPDVTSSFYYHPLSSAEVEATANPLDPGFTADLTDTSLAGTFLGWNVHRERNAQSEKMAVRVRFSKRLNCSIDTAFQVSCSRQEELRPLLVTHPNWSWSQRKNVSIQILQEVNPECKVLVHNISGPTNIRYIFLSRGAQWKLPSGKRKMAFSMMICDSKANKMNRDAVGVETDVHWVTEGWANFTLTENDEYSINVAYEQCAGYESESCAGLLVAQWAQYIVRWEQIVVRNNMLSW